MRITQSMLARLGPRTIGERCELLIVDNGSDTPPDPPGVLWLTEEPQEGELVELVLPPAGAVRFEWDPIVRDGAEVLAGYFLHIRRADGKHFPRWRTGFTVPPGATRHVFAPVGTG